MKQQIAIIGAGFSGLATAWHLLQRGAVITLFDTQDIGGGTSGIAAGLLHCYAGQHARQNAWGSAGMAASQQLLTVAETALQAPVSKQTGMLRLALNDEQKQDFAASAKNYSDVTWLTANQCQQYAPGVTAVPGILITSAITVNSQNYLKGLWLACQQKGALLVRRSIDSLKELDTYNSVIIAAGSGSTFFPELNHLSIRLVKGQVLEVAWPASLPMPTVPLNSKAYLIPNPYANSCLIGATFEREFITPDPELSIAQELIQKSSSFFPALADAPIIACRAGLRAWVPDHLPLLKQLSPKHWVLTGMGSKGLLYHALFAKQLTNRLYTQLT